MKKKNSLEFKVVSSIVGGLTAVLLVFIFAVNGSATIFTRELDANLNHAVLEQKLTSIEGALKETFLSFKAVDGKMLSHDNKDVTFRMLKELPSLKRMHSASIFMYDSDGTPLLSSDLSESGKITINEDILNQLETKGDICEKMGNEVERQTYIRKAENGIIYALVLTEEADISHYFTEFNAKITLAIILVGLVVLFIFAIGVIVFARKIVKTIVTLRDFTHKLTQYDYSVAVSDKILKRKDELGELGKAICTTRKTTIDLVNKIKESTTSIEGGSTEITNLTKSIMSITSSLSEVSTSITEESVAQATSIGVINNKIHDINNVGSELNTDIKLLKEKEKDLEKACKIGKNSIEGLVKVGDENTELLNKIKDSVDKTSISINSINAVLDLITKITEDTKLLSLNARIEAARVGEAGRGFAVVANEIQNLAMSSKTAIEEVEKTLEVINTDVSATLGYTEQIQGAIEKQKKVISKNKDTNTKIEQVKENMKDIFVTLDKSNVTLASGISSIVSEMGVINDSANQNASSTEEMLACTQEQLSSVSVIQDKIVGVDAEIHGLSEIIKNFKS